MTSQIVRSVALLVLLASPGFAETAREEEIRALVEEKFNADGPGAAILVSRNGVPLHLLGYGLANVKDKTPITPDSLFRSGVGFEQSQEPPS
jgi:CubicO group peptidase (beta-lactamase class C family)